MLWCWTSYRQHKHSAFIILQISIVIIFNAYSIDNVEDKYYDLGIIEIKEGEQQMALPEKTKYVCTYCNKKIDSYGRPAPGMCLTRERDSKGKPKPHVWVKFYG